MAVGRTWALSSHVSVFFAPTNWLHSLQEDFLQNFQNIRTLCFLMLLWLHSASPSFPLFLLKHSVKIRRPFPGRCCSCLCMLHLFHHRGSCCVIRTPFQHSVQCGQNATFQKNNAKPVRQCLASVKLQRQRRFSKVYKQQMLACHPAYVRLLYCGLLSDYCPTMSRVKSVRQLWRVGVKEL